MIRVILTSILLAFGLAMDACAVSVADGIKYNKLKVTKIALIALSFGLFQGVMPLTGYLVGSIVLSQIEHVIPFIALLILTFLGVRMIYQGIKCEGDSCPTCEKLTFKLILIQAFATSIDALSVGFTIANYNIYEALICTSIVALITFSLCFVAILLGEKIGSKIGCRAQTFGGVILVLIGLEIFITSLI